MSDHVAKPVQGHLVIRRLLVSTLAALLGLGHVSYLEAGSLGKATGRAAMARIFKQDLKNHATTVAKPLVRSRSVHRYTTHQRGDREIKTGLLPDTHMTVRARPGRPPKPATAQRRYGLAYPPEVRETIYLPKGFPVRHNKALGGAPGVGELTSPRAIPPGNIRRTIPLGPR